MKYSILLASLILTGCSTPVPIKPNFPAAPKLLTETCAHLKKIEGDQVSIVDLYKVVVENYTSYYECAAKVDGWNEWYVKQKKIYDEVK